MQADSGLKCSLLLMKINQNKLSKSAAAKGNKMGRRCIKAGEASKWKVGDDEGHKVGGLVRGAS